LGNPAAFAARWSLPRQVLERRQVTMGSVEGLRYVPFCIPVGNMHMPGQAASNGRTVHSSGHRSRPLPGLSAKSTKTQGLIGIDKFVANLLFLSPHQPAWLPWRSRAGAGAVGINSGLMHRSKRHRHSITSSASASSLSGMSRPRALAVLRLIINSNLVGCTTGRSAGFSPLTMRAE
jgi:hypothetical protein